MNNPNVCLFRQIRVKSKPSQISFHFSAARINRNDIVFTAFLLFFSRPYIFQYKSPQNNRCLPKKEAEKAIKIKYNRFAFRLSSCLLLSGHWSKIKINLLRLKTGEIAEACLFIEQKVVERAFRKSFL